MSELVAPPNPCPHCGQTMPRSPELTPEERRVIQEIVDSLYKDENFVSAMERLAEDD